MRDILKIKCNTVFTDSVCDCILVVSRRSVKCKKKYFRPSLADIDTFHPNQETESKHPSILILGGYFGLTNELINVNWPLRVFKPTFQALALCYML